MTDIVYKELQRKAIHVMGSIIPVAYYFLSKDVMLIALSILVSILLVVEWLRLRGKITIPKILLRHHEKNHVGAYVYYQIAALFSILLFDKTIAMASLLMLAFGDAASGLAGSMIKGGDVRHGYKRLHKPFPIMAVMFIACIIVGIILFNTPLASDMSPVHFIVYIAGALGATIGDTVPLRIKGRAVDDNLLIPLLAGAFMTLAATAG